jgi:AcrR family transcriptional regulator
MGAEMATRPRSDEKRQIILQAARACLGQRGYLATTIAEIAARAGVSRGLLHYHFKSKEDLLAQVLRAETEAMLSRSGAIFAQCRTADELSVGLAQAVRATMERDTDFFNLAFECWTVARQSPQVARELEHMYSRLRDALRWGLESAVQRGIIEPALPLDKLATLLLAVADGLGLQMITHPELAADESTWRALESVARALLGESSS